MKHVYGFTGTQQGWTRVRERLFSLPWRPLVKVKQVSVPSDEILEMTAGLIMHPATFDKLKQGVVQHHRAIGRH